MRFSACGNQPDRNASLRTLARGVFVRTVFSGLVLVLLSGCSSLRTFHRTEKQQVLKSELFPPFTSGLLQKFDLSVDVMGKHFNGMLLIKRSDDSLYRTIFTAYTGPTLFDMVFYPSGFRVENCLDELNKKNTLHLFSVLFSSLFLTQVDSVQTARVYVSDIGPSVSVFRVNVKGQRYEFRTDEKNQLLTEIVRPGLFSKFIFHLTDYRDQNVGLISVRYKGVIGVQMTLKRLE